jgi:hypothetical protein
LFTLLHPAALLALLGLLVPLAIHLWNRRPGREVAVGSLRWLVAGANRRLRNLKLEQLWLLLLRAGLLAVLALALAEPVRRQLLPVSRGQVLVSPAVIGTPMFTALRPVIDSLRRKGHVVRWLTTGFPKLSAGAWQADSSVLRDSAQGLLAQNQAAARFQWAQVQQAAGAFPAQPLYIVTPANLHGFQGSHFPLPVDITWQTLPVGATETWVQTAALRGDSLRLLLGHSTEAQTKFQLLSVRRPQPGGIVQVSGLPALRYEANAQGPRLQQLPAASATNAKPGLSLPVRTQPLRVVIYAAPAFAADARYLQAALQAASVGLPVRLALTTTANPPILGGAPDWLFWLADAPLPAAWQQAVKAGAHVWQEAAGPGTAVTGHLLFEGPDQASPVMLFRRGIPKPSPASALAGVPVWADAQGRPVLSWYPVGRGAFYQLHTRLHPDWSNLADSPALPAQFLALLQPELTDAAIAAETTLDSVFTAHDQRALDPAQIQVSSKAGTPGQATATASPAPPAFRQTDLQPWLVLAAAVLFLLERLLARQRTSQPSPSAS